MKNNNIKNNKTINNIEKNERIVKILEKIPKNERYQYFIDLELIKLEYKYAINIDFRTFFQYYWSLLKIIHPIIFTFIMKNDYNLFLSKLSLFIMSFALNAIAITLFFSDDSMHNLYINYGKYDFIYNLPQTIYSILISGFIIFIFELLSLSEDNLIKFKQ